MADKITTFKYHWYNCGLSNADDVQHCEVAIYRETKEHSKGLQSHNR